MKRDPISYFSEKFIRPSVFTILFILFFSGCQKEPKNFNDDAGVRIYYETESGKDLLDPMTEGHFKKEDIRLYNIVDGIKKEINYPLNDAPRNFSVLNDSGKYSLAIGLETDSTLLELNTNLTDTITCIIKQSEDYFIITKVWYNGELKWTSESSLPHEFTVVK